VGVGYLGSVISVTPPWLHFVDGWLALGS